jgi:hypothetical protein
VSGVRAIAFPISLSFSFSFFCGLDEKEKERVSKKATRSRAT